MGSIVTLRRAAALALAATAAVLLAACVLAPGKFDATLDLRRDGRFTFTYSGQIHMLALSKMAEQSAGSQEFAPQACYDDETFDERECTRAELAEQRAAWDADAPAREAKAKDDAEIARAMLGGIDPSDPKAADEFAARLRRQEGWKKVEHKGDGLFEVEFAITSQLGHDFVFPTIERFPMANAFVQVNLRQGRQVRVDAPAFSPQGETANPLQGLFGGLAGLSPTGGSPGEVPLPMLDGTFRIVTDGQVLTNNTDEGPAAVSGGQELVWKVNGRTTSAPSALIALVN